MGIAVSPQIHPRVAEFIDKPRKDADQRQVGKRRVRQRLFPPTIRQPARYSHRLPKAIAKTSIRPLRAARKAFDNGPWRRMTASERGRLIWKLADSARAAHRGVRLHRKSRQRQAARHRQGRRRPAGGRPVPLHGGMGDQDRRQHDSSFGSVHAGREISRLHVARAGRSGRTDHSLEFPAADGGVEAWPGAGDGLHGCVEAGRADSALRAASGRTDHGSRISPTASSTLSRATARPRELRWRRILMSTRLPSRDRPKSAN